MINRFGSASAWIQAFRYHFTPPSFLPAVLGAVMAWALTGLFDPILYLATVAGVTINHLALNLTDDYFDYKSGVDRADGDHPYAGGSGVLTGGLIEPRWIAAAFTLGYMLTIAVGTYLTLQGGWPVAAFMIFGVGCSFFYTAPPIRYGYRGLGELSQLINFSWTIGLGAYFVQCRSLSLEAALALLPLGLMMFSMILVNEIPDEPDDRAANKRTLVVRYGRAAAAKLYDISMVAAYLSILLFPLAGLTSMWCWLALATSPLFLKSRAILARHLDDPTRMAPACLVTIQIHNLTGILLVVGYLFQGWSAGRPLGTMAMPFAALALLYWPVARKIFAR